MLPLSARALLAALLIATLGLVATAGSPARGAGALPCSTAGTWTAGEMNVYWLDVEQGDSQLIVGPTGRTLLVDLGETSFNTTGTSTNATRVDADDLHPREQGLKHYPSKRTARDRRSR